MFDIEKPDVKLSLISAHCSQVVNVHTHNEKRKFNQSWNFQAYVLHAPKKKNSDVSYIY